jgi:hypothetical protein
MLDYHGHLPCLVNLLSPAPPWSQPDEDHLLALLGLPESSASSSLELREGPDYLAARTITCECACIYHVILQLILKTHYF